MQSEPLSIVISGAAWQRPQYFAETLESWAQVPMKGVDHFVWNLDPSDMTEHMTRQVMDWSQHITTPVTLNTHSEPAGCAVALWRAAESGFDLGADFVVTCEEDIVVAPDIMEYFRWAAETYKDDDSVFMVNAFRHGDHFHCDNDHHTTEEPRDRFSPLVWGTWRNRWYGTLRNQWDWDYSYNGFDHHICRTMPGLDGRKVIKPCMSRSQHIGRFGGMHCTAEMFESLKSNCFEPPYTEGNFFT